MQPEIDRCHDEIAEIEAQLRSGHRDLPGLLMALSDWHAELRLLQGETIVPPNSDSCLQEKCYSERREET